MAQHQRRAAAVEEERAAWSDALDVDDSDLRHTPPSSLPLHLLRPSASSHPRAPHHRRIRGPDSVQDAMRFGFPVSSGPDPAARAGDQAAASSDFLLDPWLCALRFLGEDRAWQRSGIGAIQGERALYRAPLVVGMVTLCTPNGLGDLFLNLKDPTGTIGASVHKKVITDGNLGKGISVGSAIVLKQVSVFRPSSTACYLNVTQQNVVKVLPEVSDSPSKQVISSSTTESQLPAKCTETGRFACLGDNRMGRKAGTETSEGTAAILGKISRTKDSQVADVLSDNSDAANAVHSSILRMDKGTIHGTDNHHEIRLEEMDSSPPRKNVPSCNTSQQLQKIFKTMNPANCQQRQGGSSPMYGRTSEDESSTSYIMRRLLGGETTVPSSKEVTVAEVCRDLCGTPDASNSTSRMHVDARCSSGKHHAIGLKKLVEGRCSKHVSNRNTYEHQQQNLNIANTRCSQPSVGGSSAMSVYGDCTQATANEKLRRLFDGEWMVPSSKKLKSDAILPDDNDARTNSNSSNGLENNLNIGPDDIAEGFQSEHTSRKLGEHQQKDFDAANGGTVQPTQLNYCTPSTNATAISVPSFSNPKKLVSVASVAEWTDEQLAELFADY